MASVVQENRRPTPPELSRKLRNSAITQKDLARHTGVAQSTVSRVLKGDPRVTAAVAARVHAAAAALGYDPAAHDVARRLVSRRSGARVRNQTMAVVFPGLIFQDPYFHAMAHGVTDALIAAGYSMLWVHIDALQPPRSLEALPPALRRGEVDGVLVCMPNPQLLTLLNELAASSSPPLPLVSLIRASDAAAHVTADDEGAGYAAMRHLLALGHQHVLQFLDSSFYKTGEHAPLARRIHGLQRALQEAGLSPDDHIHFYPLSDSWMAPDRLAAYTAALTPDQARQHPVVAYLRANPQITALLGVNDAVALHTWATLTAAGLRVPEDYSLLGFDDTLPGPAPQAVPCLTTIRLPLQEIGHAGVRLLCDLIDGQADPYTQIVLPTTLIVRASTAPSRP
jgi:LacI family transcriptional regulator